MFTFTKKADYALLALSYLATNGEGRVVGPREIAGNYEIPLELLAKVLQTLARNGLVKSVPGPTGGYKLARPALEISALSVVQAIDGPVAIAQCWDEGGTDGCAQASRCSLRGPLARIQDEMTRLLQMMTLADLCEPEADGSMLMPQPPPQTRTFAEGRRLTMANR